MSLFSSTSTSSSSSKPVFCPSQNPNKSIFSFKIPCKIHLSFPPCHSQQAFSPLLLDQTQNAKSNNNLPNVEEKEDSLKKVLAVRRPVKEVSDDEGGGEDGDGGSSSSAIIDASLNELAKKMPIFEPERVDSGSQEKLLTVNLDLALYKAKILTKKFKYQEAQEILEKVYKCMFHCLLYIYKAELMIINDSFVCVFV